MSSIVVSILAILVWALFIALVLELVFWVVGNFLTVPPKIRQLVYAIAGVIILIKIIQLLFTGESIPLPWTR